MISELKKISHQCDDIIIASDLDREGEAIGFSLIDELGTQGWSHIPWRIDYQGVVRTEINL